MRQTGRGVSKFKVQNIVRNQVQTNELPIGMSAELLDRELSLQSRIAVSNNARCSWLSNH